MCGGASSRSPGCSCPRRREARLQPPLPGGPSIRWSQAFIPTLRDDPADAEAPSHRLLVRAGYIRQLMAGVYSLLPLAYRSRAKIARVIREEMAAIGAQEFLLPALHPAELWRQTGRWEVMGEEMFRLRDRRHSDVVLGMTHEEVFTALARELASYRHLPQIWYQIQTKFRDEPRPKGGVLRTREFTMKDSYSFDLDEAGLDRSFQLHQAAYGAIFSRLGCDAIEVEASSGAMGGSGSVEFMVPSAAGEDEVVHCPACGYAANMERAGSHLAPSSDPPGPDRPERFATPGIRTIDELEAFDRGSPADRQIKTLVYLIEGQLTLVLLRGDHSLVEQKLADATGAQALRPAQPDEVQEALGALPGSLGAVGVEDYPVLADPALAGRTNMTTGANEDDYHLRGVDVERHIDVGRWVDLRAVVAGEACPECHAPLEVFRAIEVGHIFKLGRRYAEALGAEVLDDEGRPRTIVMGSYGIGLERALAAVAETHHDERGLAWPVAVAPYEVVVTVVRPEETGPRDAGDRLYRELVAAGVETIIDDRPERPGVKFNDAELVGFPYRLTVGPKGLERGVVEVANRAEGSTIEVGLGEAVAHLRDRIEAERT